MKNSWFTSDHHFGHANVIRFAVRPFASVEEMDERLIQNWNESVRPKDDVYFLGDFTLGKRERAELIRGRLSGNIFFIEGNHDRAAFQIRESFAWYKQVHKVNVNGQGIFLSHYAHRTWNKSHHGVWHLYGHSHNTLPDDPNSKSFDVGIDAVANRVIGNLGSCSPYTSAAEYRPFHFDEVAKVMATKRFVPVDHHDEALAEASPDFKGRVI